MIGTWTNLRAKLMYLEETDEEFELADVVLDPVEQLAIEL